MQKTIKNRILSKIGSFLIDVGYKLFEYAPTSYYDEDLPCICVECNSEMQIVRPGKYQCLKCEQDRENEDNCEHIYSCAYKDFNKFEADE